jgi:alkaline phosphatase
VEATAQMVDPWHTLMLVTADHSHVLTLGGYAKRGNPILGKVVGPGPVGAALSDPDRALDGLPYTTLNYANGPAFAQGPRRDLSAIDTTALDFRQFAPIPMAAETHGGEDVAVFARGPSAALLSGCFEQNYIFHVLHHALGFDREPGQARAP